MVPLLVGDVTPKEVAQVLRQLWDRPGTLIVVSSDLSHYHDYETARRLDAATAAAIEHGDWASLEFLSGLWEPSCSWSAAGNGTPWPEEPATRVV